MPSPDTWIRAFKNTTKGTEIAYALLTEGYPVHTVLGALFSGYYVIGLTGRWLHVSDRSGELFVDILDPDPRNHPALYLEDQFLRQ